jgi:tetratricopeptide (TPR) repeat protein
MSLPLADLIARETARRSMTLDHLATLVQRAAAHDGGYSRASEQLVCKWRAGQVTPGRKHVRWLAMALSLPIEVVAAAADAQRPTSTMPTYPAPLLLLPPDSADQDYVAAVRDSVQHLVRLDNLLGGNDLAAVATRFFATVQRQLKEGRYHRAIERELHVAAAELGELSGWLLFDAGQNDRANSLYREAMLLLRTASDPGIELLTMQNMACQALLLHRSREALRISQGLHTVVSGQSPRVESVAYMREARALAQLGKRDHALRTFERAYSLFLDGSRATDPPWAWWIDQGEITFHDGLCRAEVGDIQQAMQRMQIAIECTAPNRIRDRFLYRSHLLDIIAQCGAWRDAEDVIEELAIQCDEIGSRRAVLILRRALLRFDTTHVTDTLSDAVHSLRQALARAGYEESA